jgi:hypothetical protein
MSLHLSWLKFAFISLFVSLLCYSREALRKPARIKLDIRFPEAISKNKTSKIDLEALYDYLVNPDQATINLVYKIFIGQSIFFLLNISKVILVKFYCTSKKIWIWVRTSRQQNNLIITQDDLVDSNENLDNKCVLCFQDDTLEHRQNCIIKEKLSLSFQIKRTECIICLKKFRQSILDHVVITSCRHLFHRNCVDDYLKSQRCVLFKCPVCRTKSTVGKIFI